MFCLELEKMPVAHSDARAASRTTATDGLYWMGGLREVRSEALVSTELIRAMAPDDI